MSKPKTNQPRQQSRSAPESQLHFWLALAVAILTIAAFLPVIRNGFVDWDDYDLLVNNPRYRGLGWEELRWMFSTFYMGHYQPLSWLTYAVDYLVWGMNPLGYHLTNLALHAVNAVLFYCVAGRLFSLARGSASAVSERGLATAAACAALLFSVHPLRVESVAWATERRDVLSGMFFLATVLCYLSAHTTADGAAARRRWLRAAVLIYGLSLLSKASGMTLPAVLLVLDVYPLRRLQVVSGKWWSAPSARRVWREKIPFLCLAAAAAIIAPLAQYGSGAVSPYETHGIIARLAQSLYGLAFYLWKTIWPTDLAGLYELPPKLNPLEWPFLLSAAVVMAVSSALFVLRRSWPAGLAAWICYVVIVAPVLGIFQSGWQLVADRYTYLSCLPWALLAGAGLYHIALGKRPLHPGPTKRTRPFIAGAATVMMVATLAGLTWRQVTVWRDTDTLWNHIIAITDKATFKSGNVYYVVARSRADRGNWPGAINLFRKAIEIEPDIAAFYNDLGNALARQNQWGEAVQNFESALALNPNLSVAHFNLGNALALQGRFREATAHLQDASRIKPDYPEAYNNLGRVLAAQGQLDKAIDLFRQAIRVRPDFAEAHQNLAMALEDAGRKDEAIRELEQAMLIMRSRSRAPANR